MGKLKQSRCIINFYYSMILMLKILENILVIIFSSYFLHCVLILNFYFIFCKFEVFA
jgi:hypothetical protein